jgi:hypothetical protein
MWTQLKWTFIAGVYIGTFEIIGGAPDDNYLLIGDCDLNAGAP